MNESTAREFLDLIDAHRKLKDQKAYTARLEADACREQANKEILERKIRNLECFAATVLGKDTHELWRESGYGSNYLDDNGLVDGVRGTRSNLESIKHHMGEFMEEIDHALKAIKYQAE